MAPSLPTANWNRHVFDKVDTPELLRDRLSVIGPISLKRESEQPGCVFSLYAFRWNIRSGLSSSAVSAFSRWPHSFCSLQVDVSGVLCCSKKFCRKGLVSILSLGGLKRSMAVNSENPSTHSASLLAHAGDEASNEEPNHARRVTEREKHFCFKDF